MHSQIQSSQPLKDPYANKSAAELEKFITPNHDLKGSAHVELERIKNWGSQLLHGKWEWLNNKEVAKALDAKVRILTLETPDINSQLSRIHNVFDTLEESFDHKKSEELDILRTDLTQLEARVKSAMIDKEIDGVDAKFKDITSRFTEGLSFDELNKLRQELKSTTSESKSVQSLINEVRTEDINPRTLTEAQTERLKEIEEKVDKLNRNLIKALPNAFRLISPTAKMETSLEELKENGIQPLKAHLAVLEKLGKKDTKPPLPTSTQQKAIEAAKKTKTATQELKTSLEGLDADIRAGRKNAEEVSGLRRKMEILISQSEILLAEYDSTLDKLTSK